jgi:xanthine dehydrogenase accessory factor
LLKNFLHTTLEFTKKNEPFAIAIVVRRDSPSSGKTGDKAVINKYGEMTGWVGGGCVNAILIKEAEDAMRTGKARLVKIGKSLIAQKQEGVMEYKMTCQSEGTVEVFIEPVLPLPHLLVMGKTAIAKALVKMAKLAGYRVTAVAVDAKPTTFDQVDELITQINLEKVQTNAATFIVVATQGEQDEASLEQALKKEYAYIGFVASQKKKEAVFEYLKGVGIDEKKITTIHSPAGIDINAKKPEEVSISILAEIVQIQNTHPSPQVFTHFAETRAEAGKPKFYINPVCGVPVDVSSPKHIIEYKNEKVYFCCDGCKVKFEAEPDKYITAVGTAGQTD